MEYLNRTFSYKKGNTYFKNSVNYSGSLSIIDSAKFFKAYECGIGRSKHLGFGLILLERK